MTDKSNGKNNQKPEEVELEKNYGKVACKGLLGAAQLSRRPQDERLSKGFASQTGRKQQQHASE
jgi:hypothetical protein